MLVPGSLQMAIPMLTNTQTVEVVPASVKDVVGTSNVHFTCFHTGDGVHTARLRRGNHKV